MRTPDGKIQLIVPFGGFLGWRQRLVAVPIEVVAIAGRQIAALDMTRAEFDAAPALERYAAASDCRRARGYASGSTGDDLDLERTFAGGYGDDGH